MITLVPESEIPTEELIAKTDAALGIGLLAETLGNRWA
jgi:hypothetical protein